MTRVVIVRCDEPGCTEWVPEALSAERGWKEWTSGGHTAPARHYCPRHQGQPPRSDASKP